MTRRYRDRPRVRPTHGSAPSRPAQASPRAACCARNSS